jgi:hypothetical protein
MADEDSPHTEEDSDSGPNESQQKITFDAAASVGWADSATSEESGTAKVNPPETWGDLAEPGILSFYGFGGPPCPHTDIRTTSKLSVLTVTEPSAR